LIGRIRGVILDKAPPQVLIDTGGIAYEVEVPMSTFYVLPATGEVATLLTHYVVREDAHLLYGFASAAERRTFRELLKITGVGARIALAVLSGMSVDELAAAVIAQEASRLVRVPGIGKKTAERLLLELKGRLDAPAGVVMNAVTGHSIEAPGGNDDVLRALLALGYVEREALAAIKQLPADLTLADAIRRALRLLARA
jgi:Holliday junction DNA helicase RuvA